MFDVLSIMKRFTLDFLCENGYLARSSSCVYPSFPLLLYLILHHPVTIAQYIRAIPTQVVSVHLSLLPPEVAALSLSVKLWVPSRQTGHTLVTIHTIGYDQPCSVQQSCLCGACHGVWCTSLRYAVYSSVLWS